jgi:hypothetical protein
MAAELYDSVAWRVVCFLARLGGQPSSCICLGLDSARQSKPIFVGSKSSFFLDQMAALRDVC